MQGIICRIILAFMAFLVLLIGVLTLAIPRYISSDEFRTAVNDHLAETYGASVGWQSIEARLLPPRLLMESPALTARTGNPEETRMAAESADLRLALFPILTGRFEIDSLILRGVDLILTRTVEWRFEKLEFEAESISPGEPMAIKLAAQIDLGSNHAVYIDTTGSVRSTGLDDVDLRIDELAIAADGFDLEGGLTLQVRPAQGESAGFVADLDLASGGKAVITGMLTLGGVREVSAEIQAFDLEIAKHFLPDPQMELAGLATGNVRVVGELASPESVSLDVRVESGRLRMSDFFVEGPFAAILKIESPLSARLHGRLDLDLTAATLEYQDQFKKRAGTPAEMTTEFALGKSGEFIFENRLKLRDVNEILRHGAINDSTPVTVTTSGSDRRG
jgi:hypothetical protein